ncbi:MAG: L,D-transpeptidase family protein [Filomicrobium sp.]
MQGHRLQQVVFRAAVVAGLFWCAIGASAQEPLKQEELLQTTDWQDVASLEAADPLKATIQEILAEPEALPFQVRKRIEALRTYYSEPNANLLWQDQDFSAAFLQRLANSRYDGLGDRSNLIEQLQNVRLQNRFALSRQGGLRQQAVAELYWSAGLLKYARDMKKGRFLPTKIDPKLFWQSKKVDMVAALKLLAELGRVEAFFDQWEPQLPTYKALRAALAEYLALEEAGGWPSVGGFSLLKPGETNEAVAALRQRLAVTDGASPAVEAGNELVYDEALVAAVKRFQTRHGLDADGVVGKKTFFQLNIPVDARIRQIVLSMERLRWMPEDLGAHYIKVNIAAYELKHVENGQLRDVMRVVVGKPYHQTPVFSEAMTYVEINPYWNVPRSIAVNEELPKLKKAPGARAAKGFEAVVNDKPVPVTAINWAPYSKNNFPFRLRQKPGTNNALGRVKFMFPNRFNVYMHDTPARSLFSRTGRAFSHGCIRLARPIDMTEQVLAQVPGWTPQRIDEVLAGKERTVVSLKRPINVHLTYSTAWRDLDGDVQFRADIYRRDAKLYAALFGKPYPY